jgi:hypothetical protein
VGRPARGRDGIAGRHTVARATDGGAGRRGAEMEARAGIHPRWAAYNGSTYGGARRRPPIPFPVDPIWRRVMTGGAHCQWGPPISVNRKRKGRKKVGSGGLPYEEKK